MTTKQKKQLERIALSIRIEATGETMSPCTFCDQHTRRCVVSLVDSSRCALCVRKGRTSCDYTARLPSVNDWDSLDRQRKKLREERKEAMAKQQEAMAKVLRLTRMEEALDEKEERMIKHGLSSLNELDELEAKELAEQERLSSIAQSLTEASSFLEDPSLDPVAFSDLPESFWANLGVDGGTAQGVPSSS